MSFVRLTICCALAAVAAPAPAAEPLGRLFFTPSQRASLDVARSQKSRTTLESEKGEAAPAPEVITYGGMVRRNDGKTTVWINNRAVHDKEPVGGASMVSKVRPDGGISLQVPQSDRSVDLKVGQSVELLSGSIEESYARRLTAPKPEPQPAAKPAAGASTAKPASPEVAKDERDREEREQQRLQDAIRALQEAAASAKPGAVPAAGASKGN